MPSFKIGAAAALLFSTLAVAAPVAEVAAPAKRATGPATDSAEFKSAIVDTHNAHRRYHQVGDLEWDDTLAAFAEKSANSCNFAHTGGPYGENLFAIWPGYDDWKQGTIDAVKSWVYEVKSYSYAKSDYTDDTGHFTQSVWKDSTKVGCSWNTIDCDGAAYLFCEYDPRGNMLGEFRENVLPPKGH